MKCLIIASLLACLVVVQASLLPGGYGVGGGYYGNSGHGSGQNGYYDKGMKVGGAGSGFDQSHVEENFNTATNYNHREDRNRGGAAAGGRGSYGRGGYGAYDRGHNNFGSGYGRGIG